MKEIIEILMRRDELSYNEAWNLVDECLDAMRDALASEASYDEIEYIIQDYLGLEPDYMITLLNEIS